MGKKKRTPDPTKNVLHVVKTESKHIRQILELHTKREDDLRSQQNRHVKNQFKDRWQNLLELRNAEASRINSIREVDVAAVASSALVYDNQTRTLAGQVASAADAMRAQVAATAQASQEGLNRALTPLQASIDDLRRSQYEAQGQKIQTVETQAQSVETHGKVGNQGLIVGVVVAAIMGFLSTTIGAAMLGVALWVASHKK